MDLTRHPRKLLLDLGFSASVASGAACLTLTNRLRWLSRPPPYGHAESSHKKMTFSSRMKLGWARRPSCCQTSAPASDEEWRYFDRRRQRFPAPCCCTPT